MLKLLKFQLDQNKIPVNSEFQVLERMNWNYNIYLIEIIEQKKKNRKNIIWNRRLLVNNSMIDSINREESDSEASNSGFGCDIY